MACPRRRSASVRSWSSASVSSLKPPTSRTSTVRQAPTAPGTTVMQSRSEKARRSMFWLVTYSSACHRVTRLIRFPTLALPATAPTVARASGATRWVTASDSKTVSASMQTMTSPVAIASPALRALAFPPFGLRRRCTRGCWPKAAVATSKVPSREPSSITITSRAPSYRCASRLAIVATITRSSWYAGTSTVTLGWKPAAPGRGRKRCSAASTSSTSNRPTPRMTAARKSQYTAHSTRPSMPKVASSIERCAALRGGSGRIASSCVTPASSLSSTRVSPRARNESISGPIAARVLVRSPPPSCSSTTLPRSRAASTSRTIESGGGLRQSSESTCTPAVM